MRQAAACSDVAGLIFKAAPFGSIEWVRGTTRAVHNCARSLDGRRCNQRESLSVMRACRAAGMSADHSL